MLLEFALILFIVLLNGFFVASEFAIVKVRITQLAPLITKGSKRAQVAHHITHHLNVYLSAAQLGITITSLGLGWIAEPVFENLLSPLFHLIGLNNLITIKSLSAGCGFAIITFLHITVGEQAPKALAIQHARSTALLIAYPLKIFNTVFRPFIIIINSSSNLLLKIFGIEPATKSESQHSEEELRLLLREGEKTGVIDDAEHQLIENIFEFGDKSVGEILVPRTQMFTLQVDTPLTDAIRLIVREGYSRIPVYGEDQDNILGILYSKDLLKGIAENREKNIRALLRPAYFVVQTKSISVLLREMQMKHFGIALVVNEYGGLEGMVSTEDILEEIVGEIQDEHDVEGSKINMMHEGMFIVSAVVGIEEFNEHLHTAIPISPQYNSIGGFVLKLFGHIPVKGERIMYDGLEFKVEQVTKNRILTLRIIKK